MYLYNNLYLHFIFSSTSRNDLEIEKDTQDCTFFKFYLACYNFFASYTCVIVFFIILCTTKKTKKLNDYLYREGGKEWWGMYSIIRQARRKRSLFLKHSFFVSFFLYHLCFVFLYMTTCGLLLIMYVFDNYGVRDFPSFF